MHESNQNSLTCSLYPSTDNDKIWSWFCCVLCLGPPWFRLSMLEEIYRSISACFLETLDHVEDLSFDITLTLRLDFAKNLSMVDVTATPTTLSPSRIVLSTVEIPKNWNVNVGIQWIVEILLTFLSLAWNKMSRFKLLRIFFASFHLIQRFYNQISFFNWLCQVQSFTGTTMNLRSRFDTPSNEWICTRRRSNSCRKPITFPTPTALKLNE